MCEIAKLINNLYKHHKAAFFANMFICHIVIVTRFERIKDNQSIIAIKVEREHKVTRVLNNPSARVMAVQCSSP